MTLNAYKLREYLAVRVRAEVAELRPNSIHLAILLDVSDSMDGSRLDSVKRTLHAARDLFQPVDQITLVVFGEHAHTVIVQHQMTADGIEEFYRRTDLLATAGCTNLSAGIEELLHISDATHPYTAVLLLTDGMINRGICSTSGLRDMMSGLGNVPTTALGYGADHNRTLLRQLATQSHGSYTYISSDELLPVVMGDLISGLRNTVLQQVQVQAPVGFRCKEIGSRTESHMIGDIVADRDYWAVFKGDGAGPVQIFVDGNVVASADPMSGDGPMVEEQIYRARAALLLTVATDALETGVSIPVRVREQMIALHVEMEPFARRPLVLRLRAQLTEAIEAADHPVWGATPSPVLARLAAGTAQMSTQRGADPDALFSSPGQRAASMQCQSAYRGDPQ
jgi:hypothetical protein